MNTLTLEKGNNQPTRGTSRNIGTMTDPAEHVPTGVDSNVSLLRRPQLQDPFKRAIDKFAKELNAGTFNEVLELSMSLLCFNDVLYIATNPTDFIALSLNVMMLLQQVNKSNIVYKLAYCLGTKRPGSDQPLLPLERMPFGLIQYQVDFFSCINISQVCAKYHTCKDRVQRKSVLRLVILASCR